jgi:hypothetical protein
LIKYEKNTGSLKKVQKLGIIKIVHIACILMILIGLEVRAMVFNTTINNISVILWRSALLSVEETGVPGENHLPVPSH